MIVKAHAKINLFLDVVGLRDDGYHELEMVMVPLDLHDVIEIEIIPSYNDDFITCDDFRTGPVQYNLGTRALNAMRAKYGFKQKFNIHIHKRIPMSSGLGGGSSDATAVMLGVCKVLKMKPPLEELLEIARHLGADVPFFLYKTPAIAKGIGEKIEPIRIKKQYHVLLVMPKVGLSTKEIFTDYDKIEAPIHGDLSAMVIALESGDDEAIAKQMFNGLEQVSIPRLPEIQMIKQTLKDLGFNKVLMTGSGSAIFALDENEKKIQKTATTLRKAGHHVIVTLIGEKK